MGMMLPLVLGWRFTAGHSPVGWAQEQYGRSKAVEGWCGHCEDREKTAVAAPGLLFAGSWSPDDESASAWGWRVSGQAAASPRPALKRLPTRLDQR
nr:hypothetical protein CFP56_03703 [Quercus suber]